MVLAKKMRECFIFVVFVPWKCNCFVMLLLVCQAKTRAQAIWSIVGFLECVRVEDTRCAKVRCRSVTVDCSSTGTHLVHVVGHLLFRTRVRGSSYVVTRDTQNVEPHPPMSRSLFLFFLVLNEHVTRVISTPTHPQIRCHAWHNLWTAA